MNHSRAIKLFVSLGLSVNLLACGQSPTSEGSGAVQNADPSAPSSVADEGGEGGEGGEGATSIDDQDVAFMTALGLMKGHLQIAAELLQNKNYQEAEPHIGHPVDEIYGDIKADLERLNLQPFDQNLKQLHRLILTTPEVPEVQTDLNQALKDIDGAIAAIPAEKRTSGPFLLETVHQILDVAAEEYNAAIVDNKFAEVIEYQDSRGFVLYAQTLFKEAMPQLAAKDATTASQVDSQFKTLTTAWPSVNPPATPILEPQKVSELVDAIQTGTQKFTESY